jgi:hypothetical protein
MVKKHSKTRKIQKGFMTIPQLRKAFDHIERFTQSLIQSTKDAVTRRKAFQKEWMKVFHREVDDKSANAYLQFEDKKGKKTGKTKKQKGGGTPLAGAPLDYSTRPGIDGLYGTFPAYVSSGLAFYNDINKEAPLAGCGVENTTPKVPLSIGSNVVQKGGKTRKNRRNYQGGAFPSISEFAQALTFRPITSTNPPTMAYTAQMDAKGLPSPPSSVANTANPGYLSYRPSIMAGVATEINRDLGSEIRS